MLPNNAVFSEKHVNTIPKPFKLEHYESCTMFLSVKCVHVIALLHIYHNFQLGKTFILAYEWLIMLLSEKKCKSDGEKNPTNLRRLKVLHIVPLWILCVPVIELISIYQGFN
jgi:hypothetical protein